MAQLLSLPALSLGTFAALFAGCLLLLFVVHAVLSVRGMSRRHYRISADEVRPTDDKSKMVL